MKIKQMFETFHSHFILSSHSQKKILDKSGKTADFPFTITSDYKKRKSILKYQDKKPFFKINA